MTRVTLQVHCKISSKLEQLERLRSEDNPCRLMITHTIESYWIPSQNNTKSKLQIWWICQNFKFLNFETKHYTRHTFWNCLIRCANMQWIWWELLKIQSGHISVHIRTDWQKDNVKPVYPPFNFVEAGGIINGPLSTPSWPSSYWIEFNHADKEPI